MTATTSAPPTTSAPSHDVRPITLTVPAGRPLTVLLTGCAVTIQARTDGTAAVEVLDYTTRVDAPVREPSAAPALSSKDAPPRLPDQSASGSAQNSERALAVQVERLLRKARKVRRPDSAQLLTALRRALIVEGAITQRRRLCKLTHAPDARVRSALTRARGA